MDFAIQSSGGPILKVSNVSVENPKPFHEREKFGNERDLHTSSHLKEYREIFDIAREPVVFEWRICQDTPQVGSSKKSRRWSTRTKCIRFHFKERIMFMSMFNDPDWTHKHNEEICRHNSTRVSAFAKLGAGHFSALQMKKSGMGACRANQKDMGATLPKL